MSQSSAHAAAAIPPEWQGWIAENLLAGVDPAALISTLRGQGLDERAAQAVIAEAAAHPYLRAAAQAIEAARNGAGDSGPVAAKYAWWLEVMRRSARESSTWGEVPRLHRPDTATFRDDHYAANRPCVIEGAMEGWPALRTWQPEHLRERFGDAIVQIEANAGEQAAGGGTPDRAFQEMRFGDFIDLVESGEGVDGHYMTANNTEANTAALDGLFDDVIWPDFLQPTGHPLGNGWFWYGPQGSFTPLHHDLTNNLMAQFRGRKRVKLVAPFESAHIYNHEHRYSRVDLDAVDLERFPEMADVTIFETVIGPGDMLFLPAGWWHTVRALDVSVTVTFPNFIWETDHYSHYTTYDAIDPRAAT